MEKSHRVSVTSTDCVFLRPSSFLVRYSIFRFRILAPWSCCTVLALLSGCSDDDPYQRVPVSGSVTYLGQPVQDGQIRFSARPGTTAPAVVEMITDGRYATSKSGGVPVGEYRVEIRSYDPNIPLPKSMDDPPRKQLLPAKYNTQSELELTVAAGQGEIIRDFELLD